MSILERMVQGNRAIFNSMDRAVLLRAEGCWCRNEGVIPQPISHAFCLVRALQQEPLTLRDFPLATTREYCLPIDLLLLVDVPQLTNSL